MVIVRMMLLPKTSRRRGRRLQIAKKAQAHCGHFVGEQAQSRCR
jgi:hypothetical protein